MPHVLAKKIVVIEYCAVTRPLHMAQPELVPIRLETENWENLTWALPTKVLHANETDYDATRRSTNGGMYLVVLNNSCGRDKQFV